MILTNNHQYTIIASLNKIYNYAKINGILKPRELYLLDTIYKILINDCDNNICDYNKSKLITLYYNILNSSDLLCKSEPIKDYYYNPISHIIGNNNTAPTIDDPDPIDPKPEKLAACGPQTIAQLYPENDYLKIEFDSYFKCQMSINPTKTFSKLKFLTIPTLGQLQFNNENVVENQIIDIVEGVDPLDPTTYLFYIPFAERGLSLDDTFEYILYTDDLIPLETEIGISKIRIR